MQLTELLKRTNISLPFDEFLKIVEANYLSIGAIQEFHPIFEGYEDCNVILETSTGKYVLKVFLNERSVGNIMDYAKVIREASNIGVSTLEIIPSTQGDICKDNETYFMITRFFEGQNFQNRTPTLEQILIVTENISKLNTLDFPIIDCYDAWGNKNLVHEYPKIVLKNNKIKNDILALINYLSRQDLSSFSKSIIHGDMQRKHVLQNWNEYCILDFGCMAYDLKVYELSTFLAWFCLSEDNWDKKDEILEAVMQTYNQKHSLNNAEISLIKPLIAASYAAFLLQSSKLIEDGDTTAQTIEWNKLAGNLFYKSIKWANM